MALCLRKEACVGASSGEAESPEIAPYPVIPGGKGKREAGQEKGYKKRPFTLLWALRWTQVDVPAP